MSQPNPFCNFQDFRQHLPYLSRMGQLRNFACMNFRDRSREILVKLSDFHANFDIFCIFDLYFARVRFKSTILQVQSFAGGTENKFCQSVPTKMNKNIFIDRCNFWFVRYCAFVPFTEIGPCLFRLIYCWILVESAVYMYIWCCLWMLVIRGYFEIFFDLPMLKGKGPVYVTSDLLFWEKVVPSWPL